MEIAEIVKKQREFFETDTTKDVKYRLNKLKLLKKNILSMQDEICDALKADLGKSACESYMSEIGMVVAELSHTIKHLRKWSRPDKVKTPLSNFSARSYTTYEPYGVVLVIAPWNYPFLLSVDPLVGAVCAGNCVVLKPSKESPNVGKVLQKLVEATFDEKEAYVVLGSNFANQVILQEKYDYIFFTGGSVVGKIVATKAMETLTPVSLELGGKSPCIIDSNCNLKLAARRLAFGKYLNCGQTCIAPDYCLVDESIKDKFLPLLKEQIENMFTKDALNNEDYGKIINKSQFDRLKSYLTGDIVVGGKVDEKKLKIEPTVIDNCKVSDAVMSEEIFGPILPIITYKNIDEAISIIKGYPKPLALYLFSNDKKLQKYVLTRVSFGGGCVNDTIMHIANTSLGFGGVGGSGMGKYHGKFSFLTFSNSRSVVYKHNFIDMPMRYQPYTKTKDSLIRKFMK